MSPYVVPDHRLASVQLERNTDNLPKTLTPTFWAELTIVPFDNLADPAQSNATPNDSAPAELLQESMDTDTTTTLSKLADPQPPYVPHERFFFDDGNITFLVEGVLYRVHRYFFCRDSSDFKGRLSRLSVQLEATPDSPPVIRLDGVKSVDFDAFLSILYPHNFNTLEERSFEEWSSILDLSSRWGFASIRDLAIRCLKPPSPLCRLILARKCAVEEWVNPALLELCERPEPLSLDEARLMDFEDVVLLGSVRQNVRTSTLTTNSAGIRDCIQAWKSGEPWSPGPAAVTLPPSRGTPVSGRRGRSTPTPRATASCASRPSTRGAPVRQPPTPGASVCRPSGLTPAPLEAPCPEAAPCPEVASYPEAAPDPEAASDPEAESCPKDAPYPGDAAYPEDAPDLLSGSWGTPKPSSSGHMGWGSFGTPKPSPGSHMGWGTGRAK